MTSAATKARPVQGSMFPEFAAERPVGALLPSVFVGTNADLIAAVAPYYLTGTVCDATYGEGKWWDRFRPDALVAHDLHKVDGVDFTNLPEPDGTYDTVCFDPPYVPQGGLSVSRRREVDFRDRFGLLKESTPWTETRDLITAGLTECARVSSTWVLAKCSDFVSGGAFHLGHRWALDAADAAGLRCHDLIVHHTGSGPGGHNIFDPVRARRHHSYLLVFKKQPQRTSASGPTDREDDRPGFAWHCLDCSWRSRSRGSVAHEHVSIHRTVTGHALGCREIVS